MELVRKYIAVAILGFATISCDDELELSPQQSLTDTSIFSDPLAAEGALFGTYNLLQDLHVFGSMPQIISDYVTDNVQFVGTFTGLQDLNTYSITANAGEVNEIWRDTYEAILAANAIIANIEEVPDIDEANALQFKGEAYFIRALCYFQLVNFFGQPFNIENGARPGVPLYLEPFGVEVILLPRRSVADVHDQIIADLGEAQNLIPDDFNVQGRASVQTAIALESRLRLYRGEWQEAADLANVIISGEVHSFAPDYTFFNTLSPEIIFSIENLDIDFENQNDEESGSGSWDAYYEPNDQGGRGDAPFSADLVAVFAEESGDIRASFKEQGNTFSGVLDDFTLKYDDGATNSSDPALIRFSEMMLNRAEALVELNGVDIEAIGLVNQIRVRAGLSEWTTGQFSNADDLIDAVLTERRKELAFEGHRRMDLLRRGLPLRTAVSAPANASDRGIGITAGDDRAIFPIPARELDNNPELTPNPGF